MTEDPESESTPAPAIDGGSPEPVAPSAPSTPDPAPPPAKATGSRWPVIIVGLIFVFLAVVLFAVRNNVGADDLGVGNCFTITDGTTVQTVERQSCNESHNAEVFFVGTYDGDSYPIALSLDSYADSQCLPAFASYIGRDIESATDLTIGYFHPSRDGWDRGDRTITCYVARTDEAQMTESLKGSTSQ